MSKQERKTRIRNKLKQVSNRPRLSVFKSNRYFSAQLIDDQKGLTLLGAHEKKTTAKTKSERIVQLATQLAKLMKEAKVTDVYLDRGENKYHGHLKQLAEELRKAGINL